VGRFMGATEDPRRRKGLLTVSLLWDFGLLGYFKYGNFFLENLARVSGVDPVPYDLDVVIPRGISFYTFQTMSYAIDVYRKKADACSNLLGFALYITFFPQLIAGPILRIGEFLPQLRRKDPVTPEEPFEGSNSSGWVSSIRSASQVTWR
jgi:D-alanyl-lipoteichoic acid acyltransferase DltB (MBOAT superfamily)